MQKETSKKYYYENTNGIIWKAQRFQRSLVGVSHGFHGCKYGSHSLQVEDFVSEYGVDKGKAEWEQKVTASCRKHIRFFHRWRACWHIQPVEPCAGQKVDLAVERVTQRAQAVLYRPKAERSLCTQGWFAPRVLPCPTQDSFFNPAAVFAGKVL